MQGVHNLILFLLNPFLPPHSFCFIRLERRFFDRVAQTNRVKTPVGVSTMATAITGVPPNATISLINIGGGKVRAEFELDRPPTPPWLRPPASYKPKGRFAEKMKAKTVVIPPAATQKTQKVSISSTPPPADFKSDTEKAMAALERSACSLDRLARAASSEDIPRTESALEQLARTASGEFLLTVSAVVRFYSMANLILCFICTLP